MFDEDDNITSALSPKSKKEKKEEKKMKKEKEKTPKRIKRIVFVDQLVPKYNKENETDYKRFLEDKKDFKNLMDEKGRLMSYILSHKLHDKAIRTVSNN